MIQIAPNSIEKGLFPDWFGDIVIHSCPDEFFTVTRKRMRCHRDYR